MMDKSYNQRYKESGTTLSYKEWRRREDEKMASFSGLSSPMDELKKSISFQQTTEEMLKKGGVKTQESGKTVFGINKYVLLAAGLIVVAAVSYKIYKMKSK